MVKEFKVNTECSKAKAYLDGAKQVLQVLYQQGIDWGDKTTNEIVEKIEEGAKARVEVDA